MYLHQDKDRFKLAGGARNVNLRPCSENFYQGVLCPRERKQTRMEIKIYMFQLPLQMEGTYSKGIFFFFKKLSAIKPTYWWKIC